MTFEISQVTEFLCHMHSMQSIIWAERAHISIVHTTIYYVMVIFYIFWRVFARQKRDFPAHMRIYYKRTWASALTQLTTVFTSLVFFSRVNIYWIIAMITQLTEHKTLHTIFNVFNVCIMCIKYGWTLITLYSKVNYQFYTS